ncbi:MAG TPA: pyridoxine 5'-phosphate synthase [Prolixibacteraceae bacterium]|nr:pyridoxine 5'-phosphate synthase [Prolixibacteraceae bacterium]HPT30270.1 pyridoxine 5'-phosphate synthase [Prolixibacteraceae bacterium]
MTRLSVNINKIATLRNARGGNVPDVVRVAVDCQRFGAQGITVHPRPDERHIRRSDVYQIKPVIVTEFNIEGYPTEDFLKLVTEVGADQVTLVPDVPGQLTSDHGWDCRKHRHFLKDTVQFLQQHGIRTSLFVDPDPGMVEAAALTGTNRVELYTEPFATLYPANREKAVAPYVEAAGTAITAGLELNAGHDLSLQNLSFLLEKIPDIKEVSIGHALIADALYLGLEETIRRYLGCLEIGNR